MNQPLSTAKLSLLRLLSIVGVALVTFFLLIFLMGYIRVLFHLDSFTYQYESEIAPCLVSFFSTLTARLTAGGHRLGAWIAGGAVLVVFGGTAWYFRAVDTTDYNIKFVESTILGVLLGIIVLYVWHFLVNRKTS
jgi:hypothetical protein